MDFMKNYVRGDISPEQIQDQQHHSTNESSPTEAVQNSAIFWDQYVKEAEVYDTEMVGGMNADLDTLLIFAGLFSAVNTAFIVESYQDLRPSSMERTNALLLQIIQRMNNATFAEQEPPFVASSTSVVVNQLFFASLSCSLLAAFGAVLGKQWLNEYQHTGKHRSPLARGMQRHKKFLGMESYHFDFIIQTLPTLLQISLVLFLVALVIWLWEIDHRVSAVVLGFGLVGLLFYAIATIISIWDSTSPFSTRLTNRIGELLHYPGWGPNGPENGSTEKMATLPRTVQPKSGSNILNLASECVAWMKENATELNSVAAMARMAIILPGNVRREKNLIGLEIAPSFITSILANNALELGASNGTLNSTLRNLYEVVVDWKPTTISPTTLTLIIQLQEALRFIADNDHSSTELVLKILGLFASGTSIYRLPPIDMDILQSVLEISSLDNNAKRVGLKFLWAEMKKVEAEVLHEWLTSTWFKKVGKLLTSTQWMNSSKTIADPDEELLRFRVFWNQHYFTREDDGITGVVSYHINMVAVSSYLRSWISTHSNPDVYQHQAELILTEFIKAVGAAHGNWGLGGGYPFPLKVISKTYADDEHIEGALQWVGGRSGLSILEVVSPCVWAFYHSTNDPPVKSIAIPEAYFRTVVNTLLESDTIIDRIEKWMVYRMGVDYSYLAVPGMFFSLCWLMQDQKALLQPSMIGILPSFDKLGKYITNNSS
ncbi:hypothetical protein FRC03_004746, partial [Tulasnella sp. 419]